MRFLTRSLVGVFLMSLTLGLLVLAAWTIRSAFEERANRDNRPREAQERVFSSNVVTVSPARITPVLTAFGSVSSRRTLQIRAPSAGRIVELAPGFVDGGAVDAGALLLRIDPSNAQTALDLARTGLLEGQSELADADRALVLARDDLAAAEVQAALRVEALARQRGLAERGLGTASEGEASALAASSAAQSVLSRRQALAQAEARLDQARNTLSRLQIALAEAERDLADTELHAGFSGALAAVTAVEGGLVTANEKLADLIDPDALDVSFRVSTAQFARLIGADGRVRPAQVTVSLDVFGAEIVAQGRLTRASAAVGEGLTGRLVFAELDAAPGSARAIS